jgi:hypothetical protein
MDFSGRRTFCASINELCAILEELLGHIRQLLQCFGHDGWYGKFAVVRLGDLDLRGSSACRGSSAQSCSK